jgi:hypothetical protein
LFVSSGFDWQLCKAPQWTPLSHLPLSVVHVVDGLYAATNCVYVMTNAGFGSDDDPGVGAFLWARSRQAARLTYGRPTLDDAGENAPCSPPPAEIIGLPSTAYGSVIAHAKSVGVQPEANAAYDMNDGSFLYTDLHTTPDRTYTYPSLNPAEDEVAMAIRFSLHTNGRYA